MSDVTLYPIRGQVAQINGKNEYIVYVPRADKYTYGTVKIGDGLLGEDGIISLDRSEITILEIQKNGVKINPVDKKVNIVLSKSDVGLDKVDNTSDEDKLASNDVKTRIESLKTTLTDDIMNVKVDLDDYKLSVENTFAQNKADLDTRLLVINNTISQNKASVDSDIDRLEHIIAGKEQAFAYTNYQEVVNVFNDAEKNAYRVGQTVFIQDTMVPDLWVYSIENTHINFAYVGDEDIIETLVSEGFVQFGYYKLAMIETKTIDVNNMVTLDTPQTISGLKTFSEQIGIHNESDGDINYIKHINNNFLISSNDGENIINIDEQLKTFNFYNKPIALEEYVDNNFISYTSEQTLTDEQKEIARNNIGAGTGTGSGGTVVTVEGIEQDVWSADGKLDVQKATSGGNTELRYDSGFYVYTTGDNLFRYNGYEVATKKDIEDNIISALNTEV